MPSNTFEVLQPPLPSGSSRGERLLALRGHWLWGRDLSGSLLPRSRQTHFGKHLHDLLALEVPSFLKNSLPSGVRNTCVGIILILKSRTRSLFASISTVMTIALPA